jgi:hypothetical protein
MDEYPHKRLLSYTTLSDMREASLIIIERQNE